MTGSVSVAPPFSVAPGYVVRETYGRYLGHWEPSYLMTGYMTTATARRIATTLGKKYNQESVLVFTAGAGNDNMFHIHYPSNDVAETAMWRLLDFGILGACYDPGYKTLFVPAYADDDAVTYDTVARFASNTGGELTKVTKGSLAFVDECDFDAPVTETGCAATLTIWIGGVRNWTKTLT
jgi:hypothetical protein